MKNPLRNSLAAGAATLALVLLAALAQSAAAQEKKTETEQLLQAELNKFASDENGWSHLHWAALLDDGEAIQRLADMGAFMSPVDNEYDPDNKFSDKGKRRTQLLGVKEILTNARTPLHVASQFNKIVAASVLIANGAEVNAKDNSGNTPLAMAASHNAAEVEKLLRKLLMEAAEARAAAETAAEELGEKLRKAAGDGYYLAAKTLIERGADVNAKDNDGNTPLHWAAWKGQTRAAEVAKLLIDNGAEVNAKNKYGNTPLDYAAEINAAKVVKLLIDNGATR